MSESRKEVDEGRTVGNHVLNCVKTSGHHVYRTKMTCPLDGEEFETLVLGTHSTYGVTLDWEAYSYIRLPAPLPVCPSSGFIVVQEDFSDEDIQRIGTAVGSSEYQSLYAERHATYYLYAKLMEMLDEGSADR